VLTSQPLLTSRVPLFLIFLLYSWTPKVARVADDISAVAEVEVVGGFSVKEKIELLVLLGKNTNEIEEKGR
jgi:hypothetical protein